MPGITGGEHIEVGFASNPGGGMDVDQANRGWPAPPCRMQQIMTIEHNVNSIDARHSLALLQRQTSAKSGWATLLRPSVTA